MTVAFFSFSLVTLAFLLAIPVAVFFVEVVAAIALPPQVSLVPRNQDRRRRVAVLVPAHNESRGLLPTLADIKAQMHASDRVVVVADNCEDDTAAVAVAAGADVVVRKDSERKGKGYALAWGLRHLDMDPPDIVVVLDADCRLSEFGIDRLVAACTMTHRPVQALDLMIAPEGSQIKCRVAEFAWRVKNWVRPLGLNALGLPCQLMGTGMAFPWDVIRSAELASGSIVEDLKLGLELTMAGNAPLFCPSAIVTSDFPSSAEGVQSQRLRWEQGHIGMILTATPRFIFAAITRGNANLMALALDVAVPPLSLLGALLLGMMAATSLATLLGTSSAAMFVSTASLVGFISAVFLCWLKVGHDILPPRAFLMIAVYVIGKLPLYLKIIFSKSAQQWIRTDRRKL
jgi:cellulose synthase/poly-beta-1,6-N-acetylglucosamine synthase-like glycosyltransferase